MNIWLGFSCLWFEHAFRVEKEEEEKNHNLCNTSVGLLHSSIGLSMRSYYTYAGPGQGGAGD